MRALDGNGNYPPIPYRCLSWPVGGSSFGYKGAALAGLAEVLAGMLTGMRLSIEQSGILLGDTKVGISSWRSIRRPSSLARLFAERHATYLDGFKAQPGRCRQVAPNGPGASIAMPRAIPFPRAFTRSSRLRPTRPGSHSASDDVMRGAHP